MSTNTWLKNVKIKRMILSKPDKLFFFTGAVSWVPEAILYAKEKGIECYVFAVKRHLDEVFGKHTFEKELQSHKIPFFHCDDINASEDFLRLATKNSMGIGLGEAYTFNTNTLEAVNRRVFDFMTIRMPKYRGGAHFSWQILQQNRVGAWNVQLVNEEMIPGGYDKAEIIKTYEYVIPQWARTTADYFAVADAQGLDFFKNFIDEIIACTEFNLTWLQENFSFYMPRLYTLKHAFIDWRWTGEEIERFIAAFDEPYVGASTFCNGKRMFLKKAQFERGEGTFHPFMSGLIFRIYNKKIFVAVNNGTIIIETVNDEDGNSIVSDLMPGYRLFTPQSYIEEAMMFNAEFDAHGIKSKI
jgi:methionyl-tRNA formyltransferase